MVTETNKISPAAAFSSSALPASSPTSAVDSPASAVDSPASAVDSPASAVDSPPKTIRALFFGEVGAGKTTTFNKITGRNDRTAAGGESVTQMVQEDISTHNPNLIVLDTPGTSSLGQKLKHAEVLREALTKGTFNQIFVFTKFARDGAMAENLKKQLIIVKDYFSLVSIVVTHFDMSENKKENIETICETLKKVFKLSKVLFIERDTPGAKISEEMTKFSATGDATQLKISDRIYNLYFDTKKIDESLLMEVAKTKQEFENIAAKYQFIGERTEKLQEREAILLESYAELLRKAKEIRISFGETNSEKIQESNFTDYLNLKHGLKRICENVLSEYEKISGKSFSTSTDSALRRCTNCGKIWDQRKDSSKTICEESRSHYSYWSTPAASNYVKVSITWNGSEHGWKLEKKTEGKGCSQNMDWETMSFLTESELKDQLAIQTTQHKNYDNYNLYHSDRSKKERKNGSHASSSTSRQSHPQNQPLSSTSSTTPSQSDHGLPSGNSSENSPMEIDESSNGQATVPTDASGDQQKSIEVSGVRKDGNHQSLCQPLDAAEAALEKNLSTENQVLFPFSPDTPFDTISEALIQKMVPGFQHKGGLSFEKDGVVVKFEFAISIQSNSKETALVLQQSLGEIFTQPSK